jgi:hypothetical protein
MRILWSFTRANLAYTGDNYLFNCIKMIHVFSKVYMKISLVSGESPFLLFTLSQDPTQNPIVIQPCPDKRYTNKLNLLPTRQ